ncbi:DUF397 domain-containing protein [Nonomuraea sp. NPDC052129]|uniref:DUF397 domain-containing protein n=2 Tax=unclassified Nonomuraea TaxID=2593643 RepID=UPI003438C31F
MPCRRPPARYRMSSPQAPRDLTWHSCNNGNCVEVAKQADRVLVRVGTDSTGVHLSLTRQDWEGFRDGVKAGTFDAV